MKKLSTLAKILALAMTICVLFSLVSCFGGTLKLESFTVDQSSIKTTYNVGDTVDFSGIKAYARYSDETLDKTYTFEELTLTYDADITATAGKKTLVVSFQDPNLNVEQKTEVQITVIGDGASTEPQVVVGFQSPANIINFNGKNKNGTLKYGDDGFSGEFIKGGFLYVIGDDNAFKFLPEIDTDTATLAAFYADVEMFVLDENNEYVALTKQATDDKVAAFYLGETLIADVNTYDNTYDFADAAVGKQIKISVLPSKEYYVYDDSDTPAAVLEAKIVDAYNVTEAWQLAVIDNDTERTDWVDIKNGKGIAGLTVAGIVLHNDIAITTADLPASFFVTSTSDTVYTNSTNPEDTKVIPAGSLYLKDWINVYQHVGGSDFAINGNLFTIDASAIPVIPSPGVFGEEADLDYGNDFSNSTLFRFFTDGADEAPEDVAAVTIDNVALIGNAKRDNYIDSTESLGFVGGLIFLKSSHHTVTTVNNVIGNSFFITYFADVSGDIFANDVKCYDSYQNAAMVWGESTLVFKDSYLVGCGGPVVIAQSVIDDNANPTFKTENTVVETSVTGEEIWFTAVNASGIITPIKALGTALHGVGLGNFVNAEGKMNVTGLLMANGDDASVVVMNPTAQGTISVNGHGIERWNEAGYLWQTVVNHPAYAQAAPFLSIVDAQGNTRVLWSDGTNLYDINGNVFAPTFDATGVPTNDHGWIAAAFATADYITLSQGGITVVFEFYHYAAATGN